MKIAKHIFYLLVLLFFTNNNVLSQSEEEESLIEYNSGKIAKYSSKGMGKAQGLKINIKYPQSWKSIEGDRPHVLRKFVQSDNYIMAILLVSKQEKEFTQMETQEYLSLTGIKSILPKEAKYISSNNDLKIEGLKAASVDYMISSRRMDTDYSLYIQHYMLYYENYAISVQFMAINKPNETITELEKRYKKALPLFYKMFNSLVIDNIWE